MKTFVGKTLRWNWNDGVVELMLDREPANEIGTAMLGDLEKFAAAIDALAPETSVCIIPARESMDFPREPICASFTKARRGWKAWNVSRACANFWSAFTRY